MKVREVRELPQELTTFGNDRGSFFLAYDREQANRDSSRLSSIHTGSQRHSTISFPELKKAYKPHNIDNYALMGSASKRHLSSIVGPTIKLSHGAQQSSKLPSIYTAE